MNIYISESPLQLINCYEASCSNVKEENLHILRLNGVQSNDYQLLNILRLLKIKNVRTVKINQKGWVKVFQIIYVLMTFPRLTKINKLYFGNFRSLLVNVLRKHYFAKEEWLVDDGDITRYVFDRYLTKNIKYFGFKFKEFILFQGDRATINLFTYYDIDACNTIRIQKNKFEGIITEFKKYGLTEDRCCNFLGPAWSEAGRISLELEIFYIQKVRALIENRGLKFNYLPHRNDSSHKLNLLQSSGIGLKRMEYCVEIEYLLGNIYSVEIAAFSSSALKTIKCINSNQALTSYKVDMKSINPAFIEEHNYAYQMLAKELIDIVEIY